MEYWTLSELKTKVRDDLDLTDQEFISDSELTALINEAVEAAEQLIHGIKEDYFLTSDTVTLVQGTSEYSLPTDIYAQKIRALLYDNGSEYYAIPRIRNFHKFDKILDVDNNGSSDRYRYILKNSLSGGNKIKLYPAARDSGAFVTCWYIRNARTLASGSDECDVPEATNFILAHVKEACLRKEYGGLAPVTAREETLRQAKLLTDILTERVEDEDTEVEQDLSHYVEHL